MPDDYRPRWPALRATIVDTGEQVRLQPRDGDVFRLEEMTGTSIARMDWSYSTMMRLAWLIMRRQKDPRAEGELDDFVDQLDIDLWPEATADPVEEGKASGQDQPTG